MDVDVLIYKELIYNASLLISVSIISSAILKRYEKPSLIKEIAIGFMIGVIGVVLMINSVQLSEGLHF